MNGMMKFKLFYIKINNFIFELKSLNRFIRREDPIEFYNYYCLKKLVKILNIKII